ncbi:hypothetical protein Tco_0980073 [Tanacetum coccineum]
MIHGTDLHQFDVHNDGYFSHLPLTYVDGVILEMAVRRMPYETFANGTLHEIKEHGRMILESVEHGPLIWPTIEENDVTRTKKYEELSATEKIQADCDLKATNIILQGLPTDVYSLVNHHIVSKDLWERVQLLIFAYHHFDQLHAYLEQHELRANEVHIMRERNQDLLALFSPSQSPQYGSIHPIQHYSTTYPSTPHAINYPSTPHPNAYSSTLHQDACPQPQSIPQIEYTVSTVNQQTHLAKFPQIDSGLAVLVFKQGDDPIDAINKMMSFLSTVVSSRFLTTNNQLRNSSNPRQQATIHDGRPKRKRDATLFRDKVLLVEAQGSGKVLNEEELEFLAEPRVAEGPVTQTIITHNVAYQADDLDAYDSDCDDFSTAKAVLMANLSSFRSDVLSEVNKDNLIANESLSAKLERYKEQFAVFEKEINYLKQTLSEQSKEKELLTKTFNVFKNESKEKEAKNIDNEIALENKVKELDNIVC